MERGRVSLGVKFANVPVQIEPHGEGEWIVRLIEPIPAHEAWLFKNKNALNLITRGILAAQNREFVADPRDGRDYSWVENVDGEDAQGGVDKRSG